MTLSPPSTRLSDARGRRSSAFVRERHAPIDARGRPALDAVLPLARAADVSRDPAPFDRARAAVTPASALAAWRWLIARARIAAGEAARAGGLPAQGARRGGTAASGGPAGEAPGPRAGPRSRRRHRLPMGRLSVSV